MPPSPAQRISQGREIRAHSHKRGSSLYDEKQDDLALFNEVQNKQRENFLLQSTDDLNILSTKLKQSPGKTSDLLNAVEKNDYDWLITPPESPLFSRLDDGAPALDHELISKQRRSQRVPISRSLVVEKSCTNSRRSSSPRCLSPASSSRRRSPSPCKSAPAARAGALTPTKLRNVSASASQSRTRGISPLKTSFDYSASPKIKTWQLNIPGFSCEVPPNLRLGDRPGSFVRGSSPASRYGSRSCRRSMSPAASRSVSSSHCNERDTFSSKGSVIAAGDDDAYSQPSKSFSFSDHSVQRQVRSLSNGRHSKRPMDSFSSSDHQRHFDVDKKGTRNMFRPLLSSALSSTLYAGKGSTLTFSPNSRKSSFTTSSNAFPDHSIIGCLGKYNHDYTSRNFSKKQDPAGDGKDFSIDQANASNEELSHLCAAEIAMDVAPGIELCSKCYRRFHSIEVVMVGDRQLCQECRSAEGNPMSFHPVNTAIADKKDLAMSTKEPQLTLADYSGHKLFEFYGISQMLKRSISGQGHSVPGRSYTTSNTSHDDFSYLSLTSRRSSMGYSSMSTSSSLDYGYCRHTGAHINCQPSITKPEMETYLCEETGKHEGSVPSVSGASVHMFPFTTQAQSLISEHIEAESKAIDTEDHSLLKFLPFEEPTVLEKLLTRNPRDPTKEETSTTELQSCVQDTLQRSCFDVVDTVEAMQLGTLDTISELERSFDMLSAESLPGFDFANSENCIVESGEKVPLIREDHNTTSVETPDVTVAVSTCLEASTIVPEGKHGSRNLTREKTTDIILLCSSIVHGIASNAVNRETSSDGVQIRTRTFRRHSSKIHKSQQGIPEMEDNSPTSINSNKVAPKLDLKCSCTIM